MAKRLKMMLVALLVCGAALAQSHVSGTVTDESGEPLVGASVKVEGTKVGTVTNLDGQFTLNAPAGSRLTITYIGHNPLTVKAGSNLNIVLKSNNDLDEVVVTGYGTGRKLGTITGSVSTVGSSKLEHTPIANVADALQGQVAGLQVWTSSGEPAAGVSLRVRGVTSINASTSPLYILDGSEVSSYTFQMLNPTDIESITVLKDASSTAIYGSRAANGVIIITSKQGKRGQKANVTVSATYGISHMVSRNVDMMNAEQWLDFQEMITPSYKTNESFQAMKNYYVKNGISTDWSDVLFGSDKPTSEINMSATGGSENLSYLISYGHYKTEGIMDDSDLRRETFRVNLNASITDWLKVGTNTSLGYRKYGTTAFGGSSNSVYNKVFASMVYLPIETMYEIKGLDRSDYANSTFEGYGKRQDYFDLLGYYNPYYLSELQPSTNNQVTINENAYVNINPIKGLNIRSAVGLEFYDYRSSYTCFPIGPFANPTPDGTRQEEFQRYYNWTITNTAEYKFNIAGEHNFTVLLGQESNMDKIEGFSVRAGGQTDPRLMLLSAGTQAETRVPSQSIQESSRNSWFGTLSYAYGDKYFADFSIRRDGSSLFGKNNRWATFGAAAVMWKVSQEAFMAKTRSWLNDLNLKVSYGSTGNSGISPYLALGLVGSGGRYDGATGTYIANPSNADLTWETVKTFNLALTGEVLNRIRFDLEFYNKETSDMLMSIPYSYTTGFSSGYGNVATMQNRGFDFDVSGDIIKTKDWLWNVRVNGNYNKNKITKLFQGLDSYELSNTGIRLEVGHPYGEFYAVRFDHVDPADGNRVWLDKNGNQTKQLSADDKVMTGKTQIAPWSGGLSTTVAWKGLQLDVNFTGMFGRYMQNNARFFVENTLFASENNQTTHMLQMWTTPGQITDVPRAGTNMQTSLQNDDYYIDNASFIRLKSLQLSYTLPRKLVASTRVLSDVKFYFVGRNLFTITDYVGYDPEVDSNISLGNYPNTRQYTFGIQLTF